MLGVYLHIPFCQKKCAYCAFSSFVTGEEERDKYTQALIGEIEKFSKYNQRKIDTIYIGGGTPSLLSIKNMDKIIKALKNNFDIAKDCEFTIECNPCSLTEEKLQFYKNSGVNRLSLGVQSLEDEKLKTIGRVHTKDEAKAKIELSKKYFENISVDMLIGLPNMDKNKFLSQIEWLAKSGIKHISAYMLQVEEGTTLYRQVEKNPSFVPEDDDSVDAYEEMAKVLAENGFERYEVSNFAKQGFESRHNLKYWTGEEYIGFGLAAHSYIGGIRKANASSLEEYYQGLIEGSETLSTEQKIEEHIMLGLRCKKGISKKFLLNLGYDILKNEEFIELQKQGILIVKGDSVVLNPDFYGVSNMIIVKLLPI